MQIINDEEMMYVIVPKTTLEAINSSLNELKNLIKKKAAEDSVNQWVESTEARKMLGVSAATWQSYRDTRAIPFSQFGRKIYVRRSDIESFMQSHLISR